MTFYYIKIFTLKTFTGIKIFYGIHNNDALKKKKKIDQIY